MPKINWWALVPLPASPYLPPEAWPQGIAGEVSEDSRFADGDVITTSAIVGGRVEGSKLFLRTGSGSEYELLDPAANYEAMYHGSLQRVSDHIKESSK